MLLCIICMQITHLIRNWIHCHWLPSCELLNLQIKLLLNAIFQRRQYIIILLLQCFYDCSFHICNGLQESIPIAKCQQMQELCIQEHTNADIYEPKSVSTRVSDFFWRGRAGGRGRILGRFYGNCRKKVRTYIFQNQRVLRPSIDYHFILIKGVSNFVIHFLSKWWSGMICHYSRPWHLHHLIGPNMLIKLVIWAHVFVFFFFFFFVGGGDT